MAESTIHVGGTHRYRNRDGYQSEITINLSGIPVTASDIHIEEMSKRAWVGIATVMAQLEEAARSQTAKPKPPKIQVDISALDTEPEPLSTGAQDGCSPVAPVAPVEIQVAQVLSGECHAANHPEAGKIANPDLDWDDVSDMPNATISSGTISIPSADDVQIPLDKITVLGVEIDAPNPEWLNEPITELGGEGRTGQLTAVNAALSAAGFKGSDRFYPVASLLRSAFESETGYIYSSTRDLNKAEAHITLSWFDAATHEDLSKLQWYATQVKVEHMNAQGNQALAIDVENAAKSASPAKFDAVIANLATDDEPGKFANSADHMDELAAEGDGEIKLSEGQQRAIDRCVELGRARIGGVVFITGKAGSGKSLVLGKIRDRMPVVVCAPTGLAAMNVRGQTCHRTFGLNPNDITKTGTLRPYAYDLMKRAKAIIIDEISMFRADALDAVDSVLRKTFDSSKPFAGYLMIFIGDMWQLEPVSGKAGDAQDDRLRQQYKSPFWFDAKVFGGNAQRTLDDESSAKLDIEVLELTEVFRQKGDPDFIDALNLVRVGDPAGLFKINQRAGVESDAAHPPVSLCFTNNTAGRINRVRLSELDGEEQTYLATQEGDLVDAKDVPVERELTLKVGARVMVAKNLLTDQGDLANGKTGIVTRMEERRVYIMPDGWDEEVAIERNTWEKVKSVYNLKEDKITQQPCGTFIQFPLKLAYACSIHKSQGMTLESAILELDNNAFAHGQVYVALSRVKTFDGLFLKRRITKGDLIIHPRVKEFCGIQTEPAQLNMEAFGA